MFNWLKPKAKNTVTRTPFTLLDSSGITHQITAETARRCTTVTSCASLLSDTIAQLPCKLLKTNDNGDNVPDIENPLYSVLAYSPNMWQTAFDYWRYNMDCLLFRGWFISLKLYNTRGQIIGLLPINPDSVSIKQLSDGSLLFSGNATIGSNKQIKVDNVSPRDLFTTFYATSDGVNPISPITYNLETIGLSLSASKHGAAFLENDATPPIVIEYPNRVDDEGLKLLAKSWRKKGTGKNYGLPKVVESGAKVTKLSISNTDAQYLELRQFEKEEICGIFRVPPHMIGDTKQAKGWSTVEMQGIDFVTYTLNPWTIRIEQAIRKDLIPRQDWGIQSVKFATNALLRGDTKTRVEYYTKMRALGGISANEIRKLENLPKRQDAEGDEFWRPANLLIDDGENNEKQKEQI